MGPNGSGKSTLSYVIAGKPDYEVTGGDVLLDGENAAGHAPDERAAKGAVPRLPVSGRDPRRRDHDLPEGGAQRAAAGARRGRTDDARLHAHGSRPRRKPQDRPRDAERPVNVGFSGGEKKRMEILQMALLSRASRCSTRPIPGSTSTRCASSPRASTRCARRSARSWSSPTISACSTTSSPTSCM